MTQDKWYMVAIDSGDILETRLTLAEARKLCAEYNSEPDIREIGTCFVDVDETHDPAISAAMSELDSAIFK